MTQYRSFDSPAAATHPALGQLYNLITGDEDARVCKDIPPESCDDQPRNFFAYLSANTLNKVADELSSSKLVLPWMFGALGAPAALAGFLVPIRESGVLLPQMAVAAYVRRMPRRQPVWLLGGLLTALALFGMAGSAMLLDGAAAGWSVIAMLIVFSLARGLCSVSAKDVLGKTVSKSRRGRLMGWSAGVGGVLTLALGIGLTGIPLEQAGREIFALMLFGAGLLWLVALVLFAGIREQPGATGGGGNAFQVALDNLRLLRDDPPFRQFVFGRTSMLAVALAPPFYVLLAHQSAAGDLAGTAPDDEPVRRFVCFHAVRAQHGDGRADPVAFLDAQFLGAADDRFALREGGEHGEDRELVDHRGDVAFRHLHALQVCGACREIDQPFAGGVTRFLGAEVGAHQVGDIVEAGAGRV